MLGLSAKAPTGAETCDRRLGCVRPSPASCRFFYRSARPDRDACRIGLRYDWTMFTRATGFVIVPIWLAAMTWLVAHDVWPRLTADDPPRLQATEWLKGEGRETQYAILDESGDRLGTVWTSYLIDQLAIRREDWVWIEQLPVAVAPLRLYVESTYTAEGLLDEFTVSLETRDAQVELHGERFHAAFSFSLEGYVADRRLNTTFKVPLMDGGVLSGGFNTFAQLTGLSVGQTWRVQVFNPLAALTGIGDRFLSTLVEVTGREPFVGLDGVHDCFVVESTRTKAWVDRAGVVRAQEMTIPLVGKIRIVREPHYDRARKTDAIRKPLYVGSTGRR